MIVKMVVVFSLTFRRVWILWIMTYFWKKLEYCGVREICNKCFAPYLNNRIHFVRINGFDLALVDTVSDVLHGSILGPLLFLVYIKDLHCASKYYKVHYFADNTNLMSSQSSIKTINKQINQAPKKLIKLASC